ncbi:MAG: MGMT family protein [Myxococcota bacterium]
MNAVYAVVSLIPRGEVATYGQVATYVISPRHARAVGAALRHLSPSRARKVPWQRVINANGAISHRGDVDRPQRQLELLVEEGVVFDRAGRTRLEVFGWHGPPPDWEPPFEYPFPIGAKKRASS